MATFHSEKLLERLAADVRQLLLETESLQQLPADELRQKPHQEAWSVVEVIAHLNYYARYYLNAVEEALDGHKTTARPRFRSGWLGNYFTKLIGPSSDGEVKNKLTAPKDGRPGAPSELDPESEFREFVQHQHQLLTLLRIAGSADLGRIRIPITLSRFIRLKLGDTLRFLVAHEQRHFQQIDRTLATIKSPLRQ